MAKRTAQSSSNFNMTGTLHIPMAASADHIEGTEANHPMPHLLQVTNVLLDASILQKTLEDLDDSDYREENLPHFLILLSMTCNILHGFLEYVKKAKEYLNGRVYCADCGAVLLSHQHEQNLVDEQLVGAASAESEPYSARSFAGQKGFEDHLRACFHELQRIALHSRNMIVDIRVPAAAEPAPAARIDRAASASSVSGMAYARDDAYESDAGGPTHTPAVGRALIPSTRRNINIQRAWIINPNGLHVEVQGDEAEVEVTSGTSTGSTGEVGGDVCGKCKVSRDLGMRNADASASDEGSDSVHDEAGVNLIIDI